MNVTDKLAGAVIADRAGAVETLLKVLKSDFVSILTEYAEVVPRSVEVTADVLDGEIRITVGASLAALRPIGKILQP